MDPRNARVTSWTDMVRAFGTVGLLSFGGPAGQIALMHRVLVDERQWLDEARFLNALNFCMLLPGPEAMQLATYCGWMLRGVAGGLLAGLLFVLPGLAVVLGLSVLYVTLGDVPVVEGLLTGLKAAVLAIVAQALWRVARKALRGRWQVVLAVAAFVALAGFAVPFPVVIVTAGLVGWWLTPAAGEVAVKTAAPHGHVLRTLLIWGAVWLLPFAVILATAGAASVWWDEASFFSGAAVVTFGGAYAVLAYVAQEAVGTFGWLAPGEMVTGLGLAESTPGPLILVLTFVGFMGAFRDAGGLDPIAAGLLGGLVTTWVTFAPCFLWIFLGAPYVERLRGGRIAGALAGVSAAVVGVIANLAVWFALQVLFARVGTLKLGPLGVWAPDWTTFEPWPFALFGVAAAVMATGRGVLGVLGVTVAVAMLGAVFAG